MHTQNLFSIKIRTIKQVNDTRHRDPDDSCRQNLISTVKGNLIMMPPYSCINSNTSSPTLTRINDTATVCLCSWRIERSLIRTSFNQVRVGALQYSNLMSNKSSGFESSFLIIQIISLVLLLCFHKLPNFFVLPKGLGSAWVPKG